MSGGWGVAIAPLLFKTAIVLIGVSAVGGLYHWKVTRPAEKVVELTTERDKLKGEIKTLKQNITDKDGVIVGLRASVSATNKTLSSVSSKCTARFEKLAEKLAQADKQPLPAIEGHGPGVMNDWYRLHYGGE